MKIIGISGHAQNGKDTVANMLTEKLGHRTVVVHYADLLKYICRTFFNWNGEKDDYGRQLLQYVGTDIIRKRNPNYWVDFIVSILKFFGDNWDWVIIPDLRFPNEIERLKKCGFDTIHLRIVRSNFVSTLSKEQQNHPSETALDRVEPDYYIYNYGDLADLKSAVDFFVTNLLKLGEMNGK